MIHEFGNTVTLSESTEPHPLTASVYHTGLLKMK